MIKEDLLNRWKKLISRFTNTEDAYKYGQLVIDCYNEKHRHYHDINHLIHVLEQFDFAIKNIGIAEATAATIELSIWYHDAIYDTSRTDNELKSAELFEDHANKMGINQNVINDVKRIILITENHYQAASLDEEIMSDCDLSPLGLNKEGFEQSGRDLKKEYPHTPEIKRKEALEKFLAHNGIFRTMLFKKAYEERATKNIEEKIKSFD